MQRGAPGPFRRRTATTVPDILDPTLRAIAFDDDGQGSLRRGGLGFEKKGTALTTTAGGTRRGAPKLASQARPVSCASAGATSP
jgi:hypothetical protein